MATTTRNIPRTARDARPIAAETHRQRGLWLAGSAIAASMVAFVGSLVAAQLPAGEGFAQDILSLVILTFGLATAAFGTAKLGIASVLLGILRRIAARAESVTFALPQLLDAAHAPHISGAAGAPTDAAFVSPRAPAPLLVHRFAGLMWLPVLIMAAMALYGGFALSLVAAGTITSDPQLATSQRAWVQGLQFLGEGLLLSGISFLLARILGTIRASGGEVQESLGLAVHTLRMPTSAKAFVALMMAGLMVSVAQLVGYAYVAGLADATEIASASAFLGPLREFGLGLLLAGIVLALATIARALDFQSGRIASILTRGE